VRGEGEDELVRELRAELLYEAFPCRRGGGIEACAVCGQQWKTPVL
jgi:hypothetical protein